MSNLVAVENIEKLEKAVQDQVDKNVYNADQVISLLKHYQFFPTKTATGPVKNALLKALMSLPSTDFGLCLYLLSDKVVTNSLIEASQPAQDLLRARCSPWLTHWHTFLQQSDETISSIIAVHDLLERCHFREFWSKVKAQPALFGVPGFDDAIREFIANVIVRAYKSIPKKQAGELLNLPDVDGVAAHFNWKISDSLVLLPQDQTQPKSKPATDIRYDQLSKLLQALQ